MAVGLVGEVRVLARPLPHHGQLQLLHHGHALHQDLHEPGGARGVDHQRGLQVQEPGRLGVPGARAPQQDDPLVHEAVRAHLRHHAHPRQGVRPGHPQRGRAEVRGRHAQGGLVQALPLHPPRQGGGEDATAQDSRDRASNRAHHSRRRQEPRQGRRARRGPHRVEPHAVGRGAGAVLLGRHQQAQPQDDREGLLCACPGAQGARG
mmetsp:Transcript_1198/g.2592  ORF Transcript_1198/g.2592 Transcript_1198/m.2592 type:complete len:206 (+) Transcript_1198:819-1436(+)